MKAATTVDATAGAKPTSENEKVCGMRDAYGYLLEAHIYIGASFQDFGEEAGGGVGIRRRHQLRIKKITEEEGTSTSGTQSRTKRIEEKEDNSTPGTCRFAGEEVIL